MDHLIFIWSAQQAYREAPSQSWGVKNKNPSNQIPPHTCIKSLTLLSPLPTATAHNVGGVLQRAQTIFNMKACHSRRRHLTSYNCFIFILILLFVCKGITKTDPSAARFGKKSACYSVVKDPIPTALFNL